MGVTVPDLLVGLMKTASVAIVFAYLVTGFFRDGLFCQA
jgi:hypothetical protein